MDILMGIPEVVIDLYGLINARVISMGRYGKTREIISSLPEQIIRTFM